MIDTLLLNINIDSSTKEFKINQLKKLFNDFNSR